MKDPNDEISSALDKLDQESEVIRAKKDKIEKLKAKHIPKKPKGIDRKEVIRQQNIEQQKAILTDIQFKIFVGVLTVITIYLTTYHWSREEKASLVEKAVLLFCFGGWAMALRAKRGR